MYVASDLQPEGLGFDSWPAHTRDLKMEPAIVLDAQYKQGSGEDEPVSHSWKGGRGRPDLGRLVGG